MIHLNRIETMTDEELDAELRRDGIDALIASRAKESK